MRLGSWGYFSPRSELAAPAAVGAVPGVPVTRLLPKDVQVPLAAVALLLMSVFDTRSVPPPVVKIPFKPLLLTMLLSIVMVVVAPSQSRPFARLLESAESLIDNLPPLAAVTPVPLPSAIRSKTAQLRAVEPLEGLLSKPVLVLLRTMVWLTVSRPPVV